MTLSKRSQSNLRMQYLKSNLEIKKDSWETYTRIPLWMLGALHIADLLFRTTYFFKTDTPSPSHLVYWGHVREISITITEDTIYKSHHGKWHFLHHRTRGFFNMIMWVQNPFNRSMKSWRQSQITGIHNTGPIYCRQPIIFVIHNIEMDHDDDDHGFISFPLISFSGDI